MPPSAQQQQGGSDNSLDFLWMIVLIVGSLALLWFAGHKYVVAFVLQLRLYEVYAIAFVLKGYASVASFMHLPLPNMTSLERALSIIRSQPLDMHLQELVDLSNNVGRYLMVPFAVIIGLFAVVVHFANVSEKFKHVYNMNTLRKSEYKIWPQVTPVMKVDLVKKDLDEGPWATSLSPMLFAKKHHLLIEQKDEYGRVTVTLNDGVAYRVFGLQLGQFWRDIETFPIHVQALYAIFLAKGNGDRKSANKLLAQIASSATSANLNFEGVKELVKKHKHSKSAHIAALRHAYMLTVMATLLEFARTDGVLATAEFLWLKPLDRTLWYMMNTVGRQTAFPEISGAYAHWAAEKKAGRPLKVPMVDEAVKALRIAVKEILYEPEEE